MTFQSPGPEIFNLGGLHLRWYGVLIASGFYLAVEAAQYLLSRRQKPNGFTEEKFQKFAIKVLLWGVLGARAWYVFLSLDYFLVNPWEIPQIWHGGISIQGGILGAFLGTYLTTKNKTEFYFFASLSVTVLPLAQAIGRWGNFFNEEAFGKVTDLPWRLYISHTGQFHHPTFLYESVWDLFLFTFLFFYNLKIYQFNENYKSDKKIIGLYLILYSLGRLFIESLRTDSLYLGPLPAASVISAISMAIGFALV